MQKKEVFKNELNQIKKKKYQESASILLDLVPDYFYEIPASSTGKYHPSYALGKQGLVRHTKAAFKVGCEILSLEGTKTFYTSDQKDLMLIAILLHDTLKSGNPKEEYTRFDHPLLAANFIKENQAKTSLNDKEVMFLQHIISSHMGEWNTNSYSNITLPKPEDKYQMFVHVCDYIASRKYIEFTFKDNEITY